MNKASQGGSGTTKWAYFGRQRGASGVVRDIGWVRVGSPKWNSLVKPVYGKPDGRGGHRPQLRGALHPTRYKVATQKPGSAKAIANPKGAPTREVAGRNAPGAKTQTRGPVKNPIGNQRKAQAPKPRSSGPRAPKQRKSNIRQIGKAIGSPKVGTMLKRSMADQIAGEQFDAQIHDTQAEMGHQMAQHAQNLADIANWYGQVQAANHSAQQANAQATQQAAAGQDQATQAALAAIGGGANQGAGAVAAASGDQAALLRGIGQIQQNYNNNLQPALAAQQAGQMSAQSALDSQAQAQLQQTLTDLQGQRGQAKTQALMDIINSNNSLAQTRFGNSISKLQAELGAEQLAGNMKLQQAQLVGQKINNGLGIQQLKNGGGNGFVPWAKLNANDRYSLAQQLLAGGGGGKVKLATAVMRAHAMGYTNPAVASYLRTFY